MAMKTRNAGRRSGDKGAKILDLFGVHSPLVSSIRAKWKSFKAQFKVPSRADIDILKRRVQLLEKKLHYI